MYRCVSGSRFKFILKSAALARMLPTFDLNSVRRTPRGCSGTGCWIAQAELLKLQKSGQFPDEPVRIEGAPQSRATGGKSLFTIKRQSES
jgi:hypothetical protein